MPSKGGSKRSSLIHVHVPWRKSHHSSSADPAPLQGPELPPPQPQPQPQSPGRPSASGGAGPLPAAPAAAGVASAAAGAVGLGGLVSEFTRWRTTGQEAVASLRERIDDMWLDELMLGCDTELFGRLRSIAAEVESGADPYDASGRATTVARETEAIALKSLEVRLSARDFVAMQGGAEGMEKSIRQLRAKATNGVMPYILQLRDPRQARSVRVAMEDQLAAAQEEFASINAMKTAKSEVMLELQDEASEREWMARQLAAAVELLEASPLRADVAPQDLERFFVETVGRCKPDDPTRKRAVDCLEAMRLLGAAAGRALESLDEGRGATLDGAEERPADTSEEEAGSKRTCGHEEKATSKRTCGYQEKATSKQSSGFQARRRASSSSATVRSREMPDLLATAVAEAPPVGSVALPPHLRQHSSGAPAAYASTPAVSSMAGEHTGYPRWPPGPDGRPSLSLPVNSQAPFGSLGAGAATARSTVAGPAERAPSLRR